MTKNYALLDVPYDEYAMRRVYRPSAKMFAKYPNGQIFTRCSGKEIAAREDAESAVLKMNEQDRNQDYHYELVVRTVLASDWRPVDDFED